MRVVFRIIYSWWCICFLNNNMLDSFNFALIMNFCRPWTICFWLSSFGSAKISILGWNCKIILLSMYNLCYLHILLNIPCCCRGSKWRPPWRMRGPLGWWRWWGGCWCCQMTDLPVFWLLIQASGWHVWIWSGNLK